MNPLLDKKRKRKPIPKVKKTAPAAPPPSSNPFDIKNEELSSQPAFSNEELEKNQVLLYDHFVNKPENPFAPGEKPIFDVPTQETLREYKDSSRAGQPLTTKYAGTPLLPQIGYLSERLTRGVPAASEPWVPDKLEAGTGIGNYAWETGLAPVATWTAATDGKVWWGRQLKSPEFRRRLRNNFLGMGYTEDNVDAAVDTKITELQQSMREVPLHIYNKDRDGQVDPEEQRRRAEAGLYLDQASRINIDPRSSSAQYDPFARRVSLFPNRVEGFGRIDDSLPASWLNSSNANLGSIVAHEYRHTLGMPRNAKEWLKYPASGWNDSILTSPENLKQFKERTGTYVVPSVKDISEEGTAVYDNSVGQTIANVASLRYLADRLGVINSGQEQFTADHIKKLRKAINDSGVEADPTLLNLSDEDLMWVMNTIAKQGGGNIPSNTV